MISNLILVGSFHLIECIDLSDKINFSEHISKVGWVQGQSKEPQRKLPLIYMEGESHQFVAIRPKIISYFRDWKIPAVKNNLMHA